MSRVAKANAGGRGNTTKGNGARLRPGDLRPADGETLPAPKLSPREELENLLVWEAAAAKRADLEVLLALQAEKARILDDMAKDPPPLEVRTDLAARAGQNLPLLRQLVALHRGLLGGEAPLYGPRGLTPLSPRGTRLAESG